jgi:hypothetical protein
MERWKGQRKTVPGWNLSLIPTAASSELGRVFWQTETNSVICCPFGLEEKEPLRMLAYLDIIFTLTSDNAREFGNHGACPTGTCGVESERAL